MQTPPEGVGQHPGMAGQHKQEPWVNMRRNLHFINQQPCLWLSKWEFWRLIVRSILLVVTRCLQEKAQDVIALFLVEVRLITFNCPMQLQV